MGLISVLLSNFRNYISLEINFDQKSAILFGDNGTGKTNIMEAISLFNPGSGLKRDNMSNMKNIHVNEIWSSHCNICSNSGVVGIGIAQKITISGNNKSVKIDQKPHKQVDLLNFLYILWFVPQMDKMIVDSSSARRKFFDKLVTIADLKHALEVIEYEKLSKERLNILQKDADQTGMWLSAIEKTMSELSLSIDNRREKFLQTLKKHLKNKNFLETDISLESQILNFTENTNRNNSPGMKDKLKSNRTKDKLSGKTNFGCHKTNFHIKHKEKDLNIEYCSTGEQKALVISILIAAVRLKKNLNNTPVLFLLDDITANFDQNNIDNLLTELINLDTQFIASGITREPFDFLSKNEKVKFFHIENGLAREK